MAELRCAIFLTLFTIIYNFQLCVATNYKENEHYDVQSQLPHIGSYTTIIKLREKRQTQTDLKNQYQSVSSNATDAKQILPPTTLQTQTKAAAAAAAATPTTDTTSVVVPYNVNSKGVERPLLGVNGTGQRKDTPALVSEAIQPISAATADDAATAKKTNLQYPKKVLTTSLGNINSQQQSTETSEEEHLIDNIDVPENDTLNALQKQNLTINQTTDHHNYYNSTIYVNKDEADRIWNYVKNHTHNSMLSQSHRRAMTVELSFDFPFYGHPVRNVTVATGGFLYTGEYVHSWLAATQYIAPLMANFDTSIANDSFVRLNDNGTAFTVIWENVSLQDRQDVGKFTFSTTLHKSGDIVFTYFQVPIFVNAIQDDKHPVKVGLSDAYIIDKVVYFARRKTIYEYHRVNFASAQITNSTFIHLTALPTCLNYKDCVSCIEHETTFDCAWCPVLNRCSTGTDRKKQEWLNKGCDRAQITDVTFCPAIGQKGNNAANQTNSNSDATQPASNANNNNNNNNNAHADNPDSTLHPLHPNDSDSATATPVNIKPVAKESRAQLDEHAEPKGVGLALGFLVPICLVVVVLVWVLYAYRNPHTKSGQLLIHYRPSQWSWRRGEARYTAATIHM